MDLDGDGFSGCLDSGGNLDVAVVIDNSGSMADEQQNLASQADAFFDELTLGRLDYNIGIITTDEPWLHGGAITPALPDPAGTFIANVVQGANGNNVERSLDMLYETLLNEPFRRPGAALAVIILTDEDGPVRRHAGAGAGGGTAADAGERGVPAHLGHHGRLAWL